MDGGRKCCNRQTCRYSKFCNEQSQHQQQQQPPQSSQLSYRQCPCEARSQQRQQPLEQPPANTTAGNSTQILFVEPNFMETPSEYETFYDCFSDYDVTRETSKISKVVKNLEDPNKFRGTLKQVACTSHKLLKTFDEASKKDKKCNRCNQTVGDSPHNCLPGTLSAYGEGAGHANQFKIRYEPVSFTIPLTIQLQCPVPQNTASITPSYMAAPPMEPIRTSIIMASTTQPLTVAVPDQLDLDQQTALNEQHTQTDFNRCNENLSNRGTRSPLCCITAKNSTCDGRYTPAVHCSEEILVSNPINRSNRTINYPSNYRCLIEANTPKSTSKQSATPRAGQCLCGRHIEHEPPKQQPGQCGCTQPIVEEPPEPEPEPPLIDFTPTPSVTPRTCTCSQKTEVTPLPQPPLQKSTCTCSIRASEEPPKPAIVASKPSCGCGRKIKEAPLPEQPPPQQPPPEQNPPARPIRRCMCGRTIEEEPPALLALPAPPPILSKSTCTCGGQVQEDPPVLSKSTCTFGVQVQEDPSVLTKSTCTRVGQEQENPLVMSKSTCTCGGQVQEDPPVLTKSTCTCGGQEQEDPPKPPPPDIPKKPEPQKRSCSCGRKLEPAVEPELSLTSRTCPCGKPIGGSTPKVNLILPTEQPEDIQSALKSRSHGLSQASQQKSSKNSGLCSCGRPLPPESLLYVQTIAQAISNQSTYPCAPEFQQSTSTFKSVQTNTCISQELPPRNGLDIPLIPMNLHYPSTAKCPCQEDLEYSSRAITPVTFPTDTSISTPLPTSRVQSRCCGITEEEYFSLSSSEKDEPCSCALVTQNSSIYKTPDTFQSNEVMDCIVSERGRPDSRGRPLKHEKRARSESMARNVVILQLLHEVVHLINEDESVTESTSSVPAKTKIRNIGACSNDESRPDIGAFSSRTNLSAIKITFMPSNDACGRQCLEGSESQQNPLASNTTRSSTASQCCSVFIAQQPSNVCSTNSQYPGSCPLPSNHPVMQGQMQANFAHVGIEAQSFINWNPGSETINYALDEGCPVVCDPEIVEEVYTQECSCPTTDLELEPEPEPEAEPVPEPEAEEHTTECDCQLQEGEDVSEGGTLADKLQQLTMTPVEARTEVEPCYAFPSEVCCEEEESIECDCDDEVCSYEMAPRKEKSEKSECDCCHCRAMREIPCKTIATPQQALENGSGCSDLKFFIDSIIMDLDAMEHARRNKLNQNLQPKQNAICGRQSFPVTITDVTDLGSSSLYVKWCIHDCFNIGGYEIYVDGHLTNRYFHCNHEAAVICDVSVTDPHKIVLLAQPKISESNIDEFCIGRKDSKTEKNNCVAKKMRNNKPNVGGKDPSVVWTPSIFYYDPCHQVTPNPVCGCAAR